MQPPKEKSRLSAAHGNLLSRVGAQMGTTQEVVNLLINKATAERTLDSKTPRDLVRITKDIDMARSRLLHAPESDWSLHGR